MICPLGIWADEYTTHDKLDDMFYRQIQMLCKANKTFAKGTTVELQKNLRNILSKEQIAALEVLTKEELDALKKKK
jgi:hypothetical protein